VASGLVIGVGNRLRGDDAAGCLVADQLRAAPHGGVDIVDSDGNVSNLLNWFGAYPAIALVDAVVSGRPARSLRLDAVASPLPNIWLSTSSHAFGVAEAIELARILGTLPQRLMVYGVPAMQTGFGSEPSEVTRRCVARTARRIQSEWILLPYTASSPVWPDGNRSSRVRTRR
jgi:hydrogenase maturation protease